MRAGFLDGSLGLGVQVSVGGVISFGVVCADPGQFLGWGTDALA